MKSRGYAGQILSVDLSHGEVALRPLPPALAQNFIGGFGSNARLAYDLVLPGVNPLSPENVIIFGAGALVGTMAPASCRLAATTRFPQTNAIGTANSGGKFASQLKYAGYDHLVIRGKAAAPVYLCIQDDQVSLCDAAHLWGKDLYEASDALWQKHGEDVSIIAIGLAGENKVKISLALVDKQSSLGKGGLAAVMGAKNLKAIVVRGSQGIALAQPQRFIKLVDEYTRRIMTFPLHQRWVELGINMTWQDVLSVGFLCHNKTELFPREEADRLYGIETYLNQVKKARTACPSCPIGDKEVFQAKKGDFQGLLTYGSGWYARNVNYGILCGVGSADRVLKCHDIANRYGIDSHSACTLIDLAVYLYQQGVIGEKDTGGIKLRRDFETTQLLLHQIARREGLGDILAEGVTGLADRFGDIVYRESSQVKGMELVFDPRAGGLGTMEFEYLVNPRGGHHSSGGSPTYSPGQSLDKFRQHFQRTGVPAEAAGRILSSPLGFSVGRLTRYAEDWYAVLSSLGLCARGQVNRFYSLDGCARLYSAATGIETSPAELARAGERAWNVLKAVNVREGFTREQDTYPSCWFEPVRTPEGGLLWLRDYYDTRKLNPADVEILLDDYYEERGWDKKMGTPTPEKLRELGLGDIAGELLPIQS